MREKRLEARRLRVQGMLVKDIAVRLGIRRETASRWVRDIHLTELQLEDIASTHESAQYLGRLKGAKHNQEKAIQRRKEYQQAGREMAKQGRLLHLKGCMLYWAEGAKSRSNVYLVNSDPNLLSLFINFLRVELELPSDAIGLIIHCHMQDSIEVSKVEQYWLNTLNMPSTSLEKTQFKRGSNTRKNVLPYGLCGIRVSSVKIAHHIYGAIQEYCGFDNPDWLF